MVNFSEAMPQWIKQTNKVCLNTGYPQPMTIWNYNSTEPIVVMFLMFHLSQHPLSGNWNLSTWQSVCTHDWLQCPESFPDGFPRKSMENLAEKITNLNKFPQACFPSPSALASCGHLCVFPNLRWFPYTSSVCCTPSLSHAASLCVLFVLCYSSHASFLTITVFLIYPTCVTSLPHHCCITSSCTLSDPCHTHPT